MKTKICIFLCLIALLGNAYSWQGNNQTLDKELDRMVLEQGTKTGLVGLGAIIMKDNNIIASAVYGERKKGSRIQLTDKDRWHMGSITKSVTATMIARLVEKGELSWDTSIADVFPTEKEINESWRKVTLDHLLTHTSGAQANFPRVVNLDKPDEGAERLAARKTAVLNILKKPPAKAPGSTFTYSNVGFTIAGVMAEEKTGLSWEQLIRREIFAPLNIHTGGFGPPQDGDSHLQQPRGHRRFLGLAIPVDTQTDNSPIMGPAGTLHMTLSDLATYANDHLQGEKGKGVLLEVGTYQHIHQPKLNDYAYGWVVTAEKDWASGPVIWHNGSNTMWYALVVIMPGLNTVIAVTSNEGNIKLAEKTAWEIVRQSALSIQKAE